MRFRAATGLASVIALTAAIATTAQPAARAAGRAPEDLYGDAVAMSGPTEIIGAWGVNVQQGAAYIDVRSGGSWHQQATLPDPGGVNGDDFGQAVAISGTTVVVGAPTIDAGAAYIYSRSGHTWQQQAALAGAVSDYFGGAVAISGNTALVGAQNAHDNLGAVYIYLRSGTAWHRQARLSLPGGNTYVAFGAAVAVSGNTALIAAPGEYSGIGAAYLYVRSAGHWRKQKELINPVRSGKVYFGEAVALSGSTAAIENSNGVRVYVRSGTTWRLQAKLTPLGPATSTLSGGLALSPTPSGMRLLVGNQTSGTGCGQAFDFARSDSTWHKKERITDPGCAGGQDAFGRTVGLSGRSAIVGAPLKDNAAGTVYQFTIR